MLGRMMQVGFYGHVRQYKNIQAEIDANIKRVIESGEYVQGPMLKQFEQELAAFHGTKHAIGVGNGTDAIWLALMAMGIGPGDEVITHANTFFATAEAIWIAGATAVFVDCDPKTKCIDPAKIEAAITPKTKAIVPVHLYGQCADMPAIKQIADKHKLRVIEDNAQAIDASGDGFKIGQLSDATSISFIIQKNLGTFGDGGALVTNNAGHRRDSPEAAEPRIEQAQRSQLRLQQPSRRHPCGDPQREAEAHPRVERPAASSGPARYTAGLQGARTSICPYVRPGYRHVFHLYVIETKNPAHRDQPASISSSRTGSTRRPTTRSPSISRKAIPGARARASSGRLRMPSATRRAASACRCIPELTADEVDYVVGKVLEWDKSAK